MAYGLTDNGFVLKPLTTIRDEIDADLREEHGASIDLSDRTPLGHLVGILSERYAILWELAEAVHNAFDPDANTGTAQEQIAAITGTIKKKATKSSVTLTLTGDDATVVDSGSQVSVENTGDKFETLANATITAVSAWADSTAYSVGDRVTNSDRVYQCITAGTSAGSGGPTTTDDEITDNTVEWRYLGEGTAAIDVEAEAVETGPVIAESGDLNVIETPVSGWESAINVLDADEGRDIETFEDLRTRRETELAEGGTSPVDAIRTELLGVDGVTAVTVFENDTDVTDADGVPPHAVECLVQGGEDQDIWDALHASVAGGIATHGDEVGNVTDSSGKVQEYKFSRPTEVEIHVEVTLTYDADEYPADGDDQIKSAIVAWGDARGTGYDAVSSAIKAACFKVDGVLDVTLAYIDTSSGPTTETTIAISTREIAKYDTSRITVNSSSGTP